jgi:hypothetical protein
MILIMTFITINLNLNIQCFRCQEKEIIKEILKFIDAWMIICGMIHFM